MLTFEKIRDLERQESMDKNLGKLPENFIDDVDEYLERKKGTDERELKNIKNTIKRLFDLREKKMLDMSLYSVKTGMPVENLTKKEKGTFDKLVAILKEYRKEFFSSLSIKKPEVNKPQKILYRVKKPLPEFVGPDLKIYELKENELIEDLPKPLNDLLIKEGVIERIENE
ncbi:hypothetical protein ACFLQN_00545 [Candidatus Aenigmatarchaeota archaeon]